MLGNKVQGVHAFTNKADGLARQLVNAVLIMSQGHEVSARALWDTGASGTCISKGVIDELGLIPTGKVEMSTPSGKQDMNTYLVDLVLQNNVRVTDVIVCESEIGDQGFGALIGMDIINLGDFAVSNKDGKTSFTFRIPSIERADYVIEVKKARAVGPTHGKGKRKRKKK